MSCPTPGDLLTMVIANEDVPHLDECEACSELVDIALEAAQTFDGDRQAAEQALAAVMDEALAGTGPREWATRLTAERRFRNSEVIREVLRRADWAHDNPAVGGAWSAAAVALCDAMGREGTPAPTELQVEALKAYAMELRAANDLKGALRVLDHASDVNRAAPNREKWDAVIDLCKALTYAEADLGQFDEASALADRAEAVLARHGDARRALMARQVKAHALMVQQQHGAALEIVLPVAAGFDAMAARYDAAIAHHLAAHCYVKIGEWDEGLSHALIAQCGYEAIGNAVAVARVAHVAACAVAGRGRFDEARAQFDESADAVFKAGLYDVWVLDRLDYVAAALRDDAAADVRGVVEAVAHVCFVIGDEYATMRRRCAAEALDYLRRLAKRDALTLEAAEYVRDFVEANMNRPAMRFVPPTSGVFVM